MVDILVNFRFAQGSFEEGFPIFATIRSQRVRQARDVRTSECLDLENRLRQWRIAYYNQPSVRGLDCPDPDNEITNVAVEDVTDRVDVVAASRELRESFEGWLESNAFRDLREFVVNYTDENDRIKIILSIENPNLLMLPWHVWRLFDARRQSRLIIQPVSDQCRNNILRSTPKVLGILGCREGVDTTRDVRLIQELENQGATVTWLDQPQRMALTESLFGQSWDILFFAGHSFSDEDCQRGRIKLNANEWLYLTEIRASVRRSIERGGLSLAIFNSCRGLGIARELTRAGLPYAIVMREVVTDDVAAEFLERLLRKLYRGFPLSESFHDTCSELEGMEGSNPCASWMPVLCQSYGAAEWIWRPLAWWQILWNKSKRNIRKIFGKPNSKQHSAPQPVSQQFRKKALFAALTLTGIVIALVYKVLLSISHEQITTYSPSVVAESYIESRFNSLSDTPNQPMRLIELLNGVTQKDVYKINVVVENIDTAKDDEQLLRGVAQAQLEQNCSSIVGKLSADTNQLRLIDAAESSNSNAIFSTSSDFRQACSSNTPNFYIEIKSDFASQDDVEAAARSLIRPENVGIVGFSNSKTTFAANMVLEDQQIIIVSPTSTAIRNKELLRGKTGKYVFRTATNDAVAVQSLVQYVRGNALQSKPIAVISHEGEPYSDSFRNEFTNALGKENVLALPVCNLSLAPEDDSPNWQSKSSVFASQCLTAIQEEAPQAETLLLVPSTTKNSSAAAVVHQILNNSTPQFSTLLGSDTMYNNALRSTFGQFYRNNQYNKVNMVVAVPWHREENFDELPSSAFQKRAKIIWGTDAVSWRTATSYDATKTIIEGIKQAKQQGQLTRQALYSVLSDSFLIDGATDKIRFDADGDRVQESDLGILVQVQPTETGADFFKLP